MAPDPNEVPETGDEKSKTVRHPRWTRQETVILIEGKKAAENRGRKGRRSGSGPSGFGSDPVQPKWDSVSSYCNQRGVRRGPVQCRKRWSNLVGEFKKINMWESRVKEERGESFWEMRSDVRREKKLPGFFDREIYDVLDERVFSESSCHLALVAVEDDDRAEEEEVEEEEEEEMEEEEVVFDSGRQEEIGGVSPEKQGGSSKNIPSPVPISEKKFQEPSSDQGTSSGKQPGSYLRKGSTSKEGGKRRRMSSEGCGSDSIMEERLIKVLEKNGNMLNAQLEAQNRNSRLGREQQNDINNGLVAALGKITDVLARIADKL